MPDYKSLTHTRWDCKYHVVFIPKRRQKVIYGRLRKFLGNIFHELAKRKGCEIDIDEKKPRKSGVKSVISID